MTPVELISPRDSLYELHLSTQPPHNFTMSESNEYFFLRRMVRSLSDGKIDREDLARILDAPPVPLAVASLSLRDIETLFGFTMVADDEFDSVKPVPVPEDLSTLHGSIVYKETS